jgi:hypothetical protein
VASGSVTLPEDETLDMLTFTSGTQHGCLTSIALRTAEGSSYTLGRPQLGPYARSVNVPLRPTFGRLSGFIAAESREFCPGTSGARRRGWRGGGNGLAAGK